jgi:hypothetical protein
MRKVEAISEVRCKLLSSFVASLPLAPLNICIPREGGNFPPMLKKYISSQHTFGIGNVCMLPNIDKEFTRNPMQCIVANSFLVHTYTSVAFAKMCFSMLKGSLTRD